MNFTFEEKINKIEKLSSEVKDIHSLLKSLIPCLPGVISYEHTHGQYEFGADFVIEKRDQTLDTLNYIGVIVKKGDITLPNYRETSNQVDQLKLERFYGSGKKEINITEIWIVSNTRITAPAQKIIHKEYAASKVSFVGGERLVQLIDKYSPDYWNLASVELTGYLKRQKVRLDEEDLKLSLLGAASTEVYFEPDIRECDKDEYKPNAKSKKRNKFIDLSEEISRHKIVLIEGDPGIGKSKLMRHTASAMIAKCGGDKPQIPVFFTFKEFDEKYDRNIDQLLEGVLGDSFKYLVENPKYTFVLIADSLDECKKSNDHLAIFAELASGVRSDDRIKCVATTRHIDRYTIEEQMLQDVFCAEIMPLSVQKIIEFLKSITRDISMPVRVIEDIKRTKLFQDLPKSPIAAILLARILKEEARDLPSTLPELYSQFIEICVGRWEQSLSLKTQKEYKALDAILQKISVHMMESAAPHLNVDEARGFYVEYLNSRGYDMDPVEFFERTTTRCPILCLLSGNTIFAFKHRSFIEFYYAKHLISNTPEIDSKALTSYWSHSYYFYIGLLQDPDVKLQEFVALKPRLDLEFYAKYTILSDLMMAGYSASKEILIDGLANAAVTAAEFYQSALESPQTSSLKNFSQIHLLWLTQYTFKYGYSYEFYKKYMDSAAYRILDRTSDEQIQTVALFLLDVTQMIGSKIADFKYLAETSSIIPLSIKLGIAHETSGRKKTMFVKKLDKSLRRRCQTDPKMRLDIGKLYEQSISKFVLK